MRFALFADGTVTSIVHMIDSDYGNFGEALSAYLKGQPGTRSIEAAILAVPGAINRGRVSLTNNSWVIDAARLGADFGWPLVRLVNDFEAVAWSLTALRPEKLRKVGGHAPIDGAPLAVLGPGTGLGVGASIPYPHGRLVVPGEGGHVTMAGNNPREDAVLGHLRKKFGHVSAERVLSGGGLENLYEALAAVDGVALPKRSAAEITQAGLQGSCATCRATIDMFCAMLGTVAGNLALTFGAKGGIFVAGGIVHHVSGYLAGSEFRASFEQKGRFRKYLEPIPVYLVLDENVAFVGLRNVAEQEGFG